MLDHRLLRSPARHPLVVPSRALALAIAAEWEWQVHPAAAARDILAVGHAANSCGSQARPGC
jgi:chaperone required for assembly of F1-ATPase